VIAADSQRLAGRRPGTTTRSRRSRPNSTVRASRKATRIVGTGSETTRETVVVEQDEHPRPGTDIETSPTAAVVPRRRQGLPPSGNLRDRRRLYCVADASEEAAEENAGT